MTPTDLELIVLGVAFLLLRALVEPLTPRRARPATAVRRRRQHPPD